MEERKKILAQVGYHIKKKRQRICAGNRSGFREMRKFEQEEK